MSKDSFKTVELPVPVSDSDFVGVAELMRKPNVNVIIKTTDAEERKSEEVLETKLEPVEMNPVMLKYFSSVPSFIINMNKWSDCLNTHVNIHYPVTGLKTEPALLVLKYLYRMGQFYVNCLRGKEPRDFETEEFKKHETKLLQTLQFVSTLTNRLLSTTDVHSMKHYLTIFADILPTVANLFNGTFVTFRDEMEKHKLKRKRYLSAQSSKRSYDLKKARSNSKDSVDKIAKK